MVGPSIDLPIFQGGRLTGTLRLRKSQQREAALQFRQTVLQAWHDVDNAMVAYAEAQHRRVAAAASSEADARALRAADQQYRQGATSLLDVIAAQEGVLQGENTVAQAQADLALRLIDLYRALGGGWESLPPVAPGAKTPAAPGRRLSPGRHPPHGSSAGRAWPTSIPSASLPPGSPGRRSPPHHRSPTG